jgi:Bacterial Ig-like domain (group 3)/FG-GAP-like repeat
MTLTAAVKPATAGMVTFCDDVSVPTTCPLAAVVGTAQLPPSGTAALTIIPATGSHNYYAIFAGTAAEAGSVSNVVPLPGLYPTTTTVTATGTPSGYSLTATVVGFSSQPPVLAGSVSFVDTTNNNDLLGVVPLGPPVFAQSYTNAPGSPVQTGNSPAVAGVGDFNEDGKPDLAVVNAGDLTISILLGNENGTFTAASPIPPFGQNPPCETIVTQSNCSIAVGDFNNDGHADLVVTSGSDNTVTVFEGNGHGAFTAFPGSPITVGTFPEAVKIGDFNEDGIQDLAVANFYDSTLSILLGNGDGTFTNAPNSPLSTGAGSNPFFIAVANFNGDAHTDLAVTSPANNGGGVSIFQGNGDGTFTQFPGSPIVFPSGVGPGPVVAADYNGDGFLDLAVANFDANNIYILLGNGNGTFKSNPQFFSAGPNPFGMTALDYNGDGHIDLAVSNYDYTNATGNVEILLGGGTGAFAPTAQSPITVGLEPDDVVTADFNGDGKPDLAIPNSGDTNTTILLNAATQTATATLNNVIVVGAGPHIVQATYPANASFAASSGTVTLQGENVGTTLTLTANPAEQMITMPVTFTAQLGSAASEPFLGTPAGTVTFYDQSVNAQLGTAPLNSNGQAVLTVTNIGPGVHSITASYSGDAPLFLPSGSNTVTVQIDELRITRVGNNDTTILPGTTVVYTLQVEPQVATAFLYNVSFTASGLPAGATATFSPGTLPAGGKITNITMAVKTATTALNEPPPSPFNRLPLALGLLLPLFGTRTVRKRLRQIPSLLGLALLAALSLTAVAGLSGCSGAGLFAARKVPYSITVTATEGTVQRTVEVPLAIQ